MSSALILGAGSIGVWPNQAWAQGEDPIAYVGHGAFFDREGHQIVVTQTFVEKAQAWYRQTMLSSLSAGQQGEFAAVERRLNDGVPAQGQPRLVAQQRALDWLLMNSPQHKNDDRLRGKLQALQAALTQPLPQ